MVLVVYGFPTKELALQCKPEMEIEHEFDEHIYLVEWVWQHPYKSRFTKPTMGHLKTDKSLGNMRCIQSKIRELHLILNMPPWSQLELTLSYTSQGTTSISLYDDTMPNVLSRVVRLGAVA